MISGGTSSFRSMEKMLWRRIMSKNHVLYSSDIGNATWIGCTSDGRQNIEPSVYAIGLHDQLTGVEINQTTYLVGNDTVGVGQLPLRDDRNERYVSDRNMAFVLAGLERLAVQPNGKTIHVAVNVPIEYYDVLHEPMTSALQRALLSASVYKTSYALARVGTIMVYRESAELIRLIPEAERANPILIVDCGSRTTNVAFFAPGREPRGKTLPYGSIQLNHAIAASTPYGVDETGMYEAAKEGIARNHKALSRALHAFGVRIAQAILASPPPLLAQCRIYVSGGLSKGIRPGLQKALGVDVRLLSDDDDDITSANARAGLLALQEKVEALA